MAAVHYQSPPEACKWQMDKSVCSRNRDSNRESMCRPISIIDGNGAAMIRLWGGVLLLLRRVMVLLLGLSLGLGLSRLLGWEEVV